MAFLFSSVFSFFAGGSSASSLRFGWSELPVEGKGIFHVSCSGEQTACFFPRVSRLPDIFMDTTDSLVHVLPWLMELGMPRPNYIF